MVNLHPVRFVPELTACPMISVDTRKRILLDMILQRSIEAAELVIGQSENVGCLFLVVPGG
jgi:hypothetical protein